MKPQFKTRDYVFRPTSLCEALKKAGMIDNLALVREPRLAKDGKVISADFKAAA